MVIKDNRVKTPHGNTILWKYMSLEKFIDLLISNELYFTNASKLTDKYEGMIPLKSYDSYRKELIQQNLSEEEIQERISVLTYSAQTFRDLTLVSCWTMNRFESYALWKIYLSGSKGGVAIRTTASKIKEAIKNGGETYDEDIFFGIIEYSDFLEDPNSRFQWITRKTRFYDYEKEARLFIFHYPKSEGGGNPPYKISNGRRFKVDLNLLLDKIYLSPFTAEWFAKSFNEAIERLRPDLVERIQQSEILDD